jgi:hypothetical protein
VTLAADDSPAATGAWRVIQLEQNSEQLFEAIEPRRAAVGFPTRRNRGVVGSSLAVQLFVDCVGEEMDLVTRELHGGNSGWVVGMVGERSEKSCEKSCEKSATRSSRVAALPNSLLGASSI